MRYMFILVGSFFVKQAILIEEVDAHVKPKHVANAKSPRSHIRALVCRYCFKVVDKERNTGISWSNSTVLSPRTDSLLSH
jgi:hypothetical protein